MADDQPQKQQLQQATLGGGCFWCLEPVFAQVKGVEKVEPGYAGGSLAHPTYEQVCTGTTGHAEVVQITFDPAQVSYQDLLHVFFAIHDPTTLNRQGADVGTHYRSVIFHHDEEQADVARQVMAQLEQEGVWSDPIVTELTPFEDFYPAEEYHYNYYQRNPYQPYCQVVIAPKLDKFRRRFGQLIRAR